MFKKAFSFEGRIGRSEYGVSFIIYLVSAVFMNAVIESAPFVSLFYIPLLWFFWAQGAKRCHDMNNSGWYQIIPFYVFWMIFAVGDPGLNRFDTEFTQPNAYRQPATQSDILDSDLSL